MRSVVLIILAIVESESKQMKYVYLLRIGPNQYKVGIAVNVTKRVKTLQTSNPNRIQIVMTRLVGDAYSVEYEIHQALKSTKLDGGREWFELTAEQALHLAIHLNKYPEIDMTKPITIENALARYDTHQKNIETKLDRVLAMDEEYLNSRKAERIAIQQAKLERKLVREINMSDETLYEKAVEHIKMESRASTSFLQRRLAIGYGRAARIMDKLEKNGIIGPMDGPHQRELLVDNATAEIAKKMI